MSELTLAFVKQFDTDLRMLAQQKDSRLSKAATDRGTITGSSFTANRLAKSDKTPQRNVRFGDTVWSTPDHSTRIALMRDYYDALPVDRFDEPKVLANPAAGGYMANLHSGWNRRTDDIIYRALIDDALAQATETTTTTVALPSSQIIVDGGTAFTKAKLLTARKIFRANEADAHAGEELFIIYTADMLEDILADTTLTSADYMAVKMLQDGDVSGKWCGFSWIPFEGIDETGGVASTVAWAKSAVHVGKGFVEGKAQRRADKQDALQLSMAGSNGAVRVEEEKVVKINFTV